MKLSILFFFLFIISDLAIAQVPDPEQLKGVDFNFHYGKLFKHTSKMDHIHSDQIISYEISIYKQTSGARQWHQLHKYPILGLSFMHTRFGNPGLLGNAYGLFPYLSFNLKQSNLLSLRFKIGTGLAYLDNIYDIIDNPENNAIGSGINNITYFAFGSNWLFSEKISLKTYITFYHFSNGNWKLPNLGLNAPSFTLGLKYAFGNTTVSKTVLSEVQKDTLSKALKKYYFNVKLAWGVKEYLLPGGPKYPIYILAFHVGKNLSPVNRLSLGLDISYNTSVYHLIINSSIFENKEAIKSFRVGFEIGDEILFDKIGLLVQLGYYLYNPFLKVSSIYSRLGIKYYFLHERLFAGVFLKAHYIRADYAELGLGVRF